MIENNTRTNQSDRMLALQTFITRQGLMGDFSLCAKDMSHRHYYRLVCGDTSHIVMDAPPPEKPAQFVVLSEFLIRQGVRAPNVLAFDERNGFVLLEDFGDTTFTAVLNEGLTRELELYQTATAVLETLKDCARPSFIEDYSVAKLVAEVSIFIDWYWPYVKGAKAPALIKESFLALWTDLFKALPPTPKTLVLRDFHVDNIMIIDEPLSKDTCGVLDFQDALWGSVVYDFVSLLEDARRDVSMDVVHNCSQQFLAMYPKDLHSALETTAKILGAGRHVKVMGVFTRYALRQGNESKCVHLPRLWRYLDQHLKDPIFDQIAEWFKMNFPSAMQRGVAAA